MNLLDQLVDFYIKYEGFHKTRLDERSIKDYFIAMEHAGRLIVCKEGKTLYGYCDFARLSFDQFGWVILSDTISPEMNSEFGRICFVTTICIAPEFRGTGVIQWLKKELLRLNPEADYIVGKRQGKRYKPLVVFKGKREWVHGNI